MMVRQLVLINIINNVTSQKFSSGWNVVWNESKFCFLEKNITYATLLYKSEIDSES